MNIVFETPRLILRQFTKDDSKLILQLNSDPQIVKYVHEPILTGLKDAEKIILDTILPQYKNNLGRWATYTKNNNEFIGWCGLKYRAELDEIDLGYRLIKKAWGMGFATEAAKHTLDHGISKLNIDIITGRAHVENIASIKVLEKIGMQFIGKGIIDDCPVRTYTASKPSN
ncbi:MAG TPA: GNAT family N-acetyltransferase [Chitinophagaceae bacterium]|nr:GNAT family N-acetyltransferase [Chitinophagaceae bacterium]